VLFFLCFLTPFLIVTYNALYLYLLKGRGAALHTISLCMIVKNEEEVLERCLESVASFCDEIIIVDTGSTDRTKEIAAKYTNNIVDFDWVYDFSAARNYAFNHATKDFILWLDADDILLSEDQQKFELLKQELTEDIDAVSMLYNLSLNDLGEPTFQFRRNRLVKRARNFQWVGAVHEYLEVSGKTLHSDISITHGSVKKKSIDAERNLTIYERLLSQGKIFTPRELFYYANELKDNMQYKKAVDYYQKFLAEEKGWVEDKIVACYNLSHCHEMLGEHKTANQALLFVLNYSEPRPEFCCKFGKTLMNKNQFQTAIYWFLQALECTTEHNFAFHKKEYATWYPHLQLCLCYWELGNEKKAAFHNEKALEYRPGDKTLLANAAFFTDYFESEDQ
jgi:glycosyltransferase involved in cell wall biosynthesis